MWGLKMSSLLMIMPKQHFFFFTCLNIVSHKFCWCVVGSVNLSILPRSCLLLISVWTIFYDSFQYSNRIDHFPGYKTLVKQFNHWTCCATFTWHMNCKAFSWSSSLTFSQVFQEITALVSTVPHSKKILGSMFSLQTLVSPTVHLVQLLSLDWPWVWILVQMVVCLYIFTMDRLTVCPGLVCLLMCCEVSELQCFRQRPACYLSLCRYNTVLQLSLFKFYLNNRHHHHWYHHYVWIEKSYKTFIYLFLD